MTTPASRLRLFTHDLPRNVVATLAVILFCALGATYLLRIGPNFANNLVLSTCIGMTALLLIHGARGLLWRAVTPRRSVCAAVLLACAALSLGLGNLLASYVLRLPAVSLIPARDSGVIGVIVLTMLACAGSTLFFWNRATTAAQKTRLAIIEKQAVQAQLHMLQTQIAPHMLFASLATLQTLIANEPLRARQMLDQLMHYLRATLSTSRSAPTTLEQEFALAKAYLGLMSLRMGMRLTYALHLPDALRRLPVAPMLLQPLVENAIRHGLEPKREGGDCAVHVTRHQDLLVLSVFDTGIGLDASASYNRPGSTHSGLATIRARLDALYGPRAELTLSRHIPQGTVAQITMPVNMPH